jgi:hypothetical protein
MGTDPFELLEQTLRSSGARTVFELLLRTAREERNYFQLFEARLMQQRHELGLPLLYSGVISDLPAEHQSAYSAALMDAARETGGLFLADGDIERAWPYFRAVGDAAPVASAIELLPSCEGNERVIEIALQEGVNPRKGFELLIEQRGLCSAVEFATRTTDPQRRRTFLQVLIRAVHKEVQGRIKEAIAAREGSAPDTDRLPELINGGECGREWLFDGGRYYTENSHLASLVQASPELEDKGTLGLALELAEYALHLAPMFHFPGSPPFEDLYQDHAQYLRALLEFNALGYGTLGQESGADAVEHFRRKLDASVDGSAEVLAGLLSRLGRYEEALQVSIDHLDGRSAIELCQMAGDYQRLCDVARERGDPVAFAAGLIQLV